MRLFRPRPKKVIGNTTIVRKKGPYLISFNMGFSGLPFVDALKKGG
ncbi:MAG: hypothetical protein WC501_04605 [Candidatus Micrarchaeia archaeon]